jgi:hypothetical protein
MMVGMPSDDVRYPLVVLLSESLGYRTLPLSGLAGSK